MSNVVALVSGNSPVVSEEVAARDFERFVEGMGLDLDETGLDEDDRKGLSENRRKVIRAIMKGNLVIDDEGRAVFTPVSGGDAITFSEPKGKIYLAMDQGKRDHLGEKMNKAMADLTGQPPVRFANMPLRDHKVCTAITNLFFGSR